VNSKSVNSFKTAYTIVITAKIWTTEANQDYQVQVHQLTSSV